MHKVTKLMSQLVCYALFAVVIAYFSSSPAYQYAPADVAIVKLSFSHAAERVAPCVRLTPEEVAALAPNMRRTETCERQRLPLQIELDVDGRQVFTQHAMPTGLWGDGPASVYEKLTLPPGNYVFELRLRDTARDEGWDYSHSQSVTLQAGHYLTISFNAARGGFEIR